MGKRIVGHYYCRLMESVPTLYHQVNTIETNIVGLTFKYRCSLVFPDDAGPDYGFVAGDKVMDIFDLLKVHYDGSRVVAYKADDFNRAEYELIGGQFEFSDGVHQEVDLMQLDQLIQKNATKLIKKPMEVTAIDTEPTDDPVTSSTYSGNWQVGNSDGFRSLISQPTLTDDNLKDNLLDLVMTIDMLSGKLESLKNRSVQPDDIMRYRAETPIRRAEAIAWYDLTRRMIDIGQAIKSLRQASAANAKYIEVLRQRYSEK